MIALVLALTLAPHAPAQTNADEYTREMALAKNYLQERRFDEALDALNKAYQAKPQDEALIQMGYAFLSQGKGTEAMDVFNHVLSEGGEVPLELQHQHAFGMCFGTLSISAEKIRWLNADKKETFEVQPAQIEKSSTPDHAVIGGTGRTPFLILRVNGRNWSFVYPLYGANGNYRRGSNAIIYSGDELENAKKANSVVAQLITGAATAKVNPPVASQAKAAPTSSAVPVAANPNTATPAAAPAAVPPTNNQTSTRATSPAEPVETVSNAPSAELREGQTPEEVEKMLGKPNDTVALKGSLVYIYPTVKVIFENGKLADVQYQQK